ncbi:MAG: CoA transferase [Bacteroidetes bacterium]|nr:CoA transferase [Bacteroidota bacterium]MBK8487562.1 CoA transferase [Bacteroidota bacterium]MBK8682692.1 CoA transferase [Bacteroidota bacterium]
MINKLKVIEFAGILAGPAVGMFFAEMGAKVIKIENPKTGGDAARFWKLPEEINSEKTSAYFNSVNWNKEHVFLDLENLDDYKGMLELVKDADIIICNWKKGDAEKLNVDYETLKTINPKIIYGQIFGFDANSDRVAFDMVMQAETGWLSMNGIDKNTLCKIPVAIIDLFAAHQLKEGILIALLNRQNSNSGMQVTVSLWDAAIASLANQSSNWLNAEHLPQPMGLLHPNIAPYGEVVTTKDEIQFVLAVGTDKQFKNLCELLNLNQLAKELSYKTNVQRVVHRKELLPLLQEKISAISSKNFMQSCEENKIPVGVIRNVQQLFEVPEAQALILEDAEGRRVKSAIFKIAP